MRTLILIALVLTTALVPVAAASDDPPGTGCRLKWSPATEPVSGTGTPLDGRTVDLPSGVECW